tara:strand:- start:14943 stop:15893 length:951 start_codon:yes stop_codon:yes gene_type:complete
MSTSPKSNRYFVGIAWFVLSLVIGISNDALTKHLGQELHSVQITFLRFLFGTLSLLPFMLYYGKDAFYTSRLGMHVFRGGLLFGGIALFCYGLVIAPMTVVTTLNFTIPLFTLVLAMFFLSERVGAARWIATIVGFVGVIVVLEPTHVDFNPQTMLLLLSAAMFATLDVFNKKFVVKESMLAMLFYTALFTTLIGLVPAIAVWKTPSLLELGIFFCLGCGANLLLYCLLKAFSNTDASALAPFRYVELMLAAATGFFVFGEIPKVATLLGAAIIIPSTLFVVWQDAKRSKREQASDDADFSDEDAILAELPETVEG